MGLSSFTFVQCAPKTHLFCNRMRFGRSWSSKVDNFGTNWKRLCDFLLVRHCDYGPILHRFWDTTTYWLKVAYYFSYPSLIRRPRSMFLLVRHCDYGPILHRFWDTTTYWLKVAYYFSYPSLIRRPRSMFLLEFRVKVNREETRVMGLSSSEDPMIVAWVILTQWQRVTDGQTDGRTDLL